MDNGNKIIDVFIVSYHPDQGSLRKIVNRIIEAQREMITRFAVKIWDNTENGCTFLKDLVNNNIAIDVFNSKNNIGYGNAINKLEEISDADYSLVLNQDAVPFEGAIQKAFSKVYKSDSLVAVWEFRHFPYEHPKAYCPVSCKTEWFSGAAFIVRNSLFKKIGGFEPRIFMYGEDVDLSFRFRSSGFSLYYMPDCLVDHPDFSSDGMQKPSQIKYDQINNLLLRARYGSLFDIFSGIFLYLAELIIRIWRKENFSLFGNMILLLKNFFYFRRTGINLRKVNHWKFHGWKYCSHRMGAHFKSEYNYHQNNDVSPLVSIIIRTSGRVGLLKEAIKTVLNQTYPAFEIIVVDDDSQECAKALCKELKGDGKPIRYLATGGSVGRSKAANMGLSVAAGELIGFLDDDDQLYCDHLETLISTYLKNNKLVVYGFAEEVPTKILNADNGEYIEGLARHCYCQDFSRVLLWYKNYLPIQSVLFHRSLYETMGGIDERLDQYEDWSLWVKYSTKTDFICVQKTTSRYRVPLDRFHNWQRENKFINAFGMACGTHTWQQYKVSPEDFRKMVYEYLQRRGIIVLTKENIARLVITMRDFFSRIFM